MNVAKHVPSATIGAGIAVGLHNAAKFEAEHPWISEDFTEIMLNPLIPQEHKDNMWRQMQNDPLLGSSNQNSILPHINVNDLPQLNPFAPHNRSLFSTSMLVDPRFNKPSILSTPINNRPKPILFITTDDGDRYLEWSKSLEFSSTILKAHELSVVIANYKNSSDSGICKVQKIYSADDPNTKKITAKQQIQIGNIPIYGINPGNITRENSGVLFELIACFVFKISRSFCYAT